MNGEGLAWYAGIFDGEGYVGIHVSGGRESLRVGVSNTEIELVSPFLEFGGHLREQAWARNPRWKLAYRWEISHRKAAGFLRQVLPYLRSPKKIAASKLAIEFQERKILPGQHGSDEYEAEQADYHARMKEINRRGAILGVIQGR